VACFQTKYPNLGKLWRALQWKMWAFLWPFSTFYGHLVHFMAIWYILWPFGTFYGHLEHFIAIWHNGYRGHLVYFSPFGKLYLEKSGSSDC
jgi:hypothetical protein